MLPTCLLASSDGSVMNISHPGLRLNGSILGEDAKGFFFFHVVHSLPLRVFYTADHFKEICPAGHGYTYSLSDVQISVRHLGEDGVQSTGLSWEEQSRLHPQIPPSHPSLSLPFGPQFPSYPQTPQIPQYPEYPETPQVPRDPLAPQQPLHPSHPVRESLEWPEGENKMANHCQVTFILSEM